MVTASILDLSNFKFQEFIMMSPIEFYLPGTYPPLFFFFFLGDKMEYKGEPLPEKIPWEGEFTLRSDP